MKISYCRHHILIVPPGSQAHSQSNVILCVEASMKKFSGMCVGVALMLGFAGAAAAQDDGLAYESIQAGNWGQAEAELRAGLSQTPNDPMKLLNLAFVLQKSGKADEAAGVYAQVLQLDRDPLVAIGSETNTRPMRAKLLARKGMAALDK